MQLSLEYLISYQSLKLLPRAGWRLEDKAETVASHVWGVSVLILELAPILAPKADLLKALKMALHHDTAEITVGDIVPKDKIPAEIKHAKELEALKILVSKSCVASETIDLWQELEEAKTLEAKFVKTMDRLDMVLQVVYYVRNGMIAKERAKEEFMVSAKRTFVECGYPQLCNTIDSLI